MNKAVDEYDQLHKPSETELSIKDDIKNVKCKDIIDYADGKRVSLIEAKINEVLGSGTNLKSVLISEGLSEKEYQNFRKKVVTITGKKLKGFGL